MPTPPMISSPGEFHEVSIDYPELVRTLVDLTDEEERREFFKNVRHLRDHAVVSRLADEVVHLGLVDLQEAESLALAVLWLAEDLQDHYCKGRSYRAAANVSYLKGEYKTALGYYSAALECFEQVGDEKETAITCSSGLHTLVFLGEYEKAFEWAKTGRKIFRDLGDRLRLARLEGNLGNVLFRQDRWREAAECFESAYNEFLRVGEPRDVAISLRNMAVCHVSLNNFQQALRFYEEARDYCEKNELAVLVGEIDYNIAYLYSLRGEYTDAIQLYRTTRRRCEELGERYHMALCDLDQSEIFLELSLVSEAADLAQEALVSFEKLEMHYETAKALTNLAIARSREGKAFLALDLFGKAREIFVAEQNRVWPALIDLYEALVLDRAGRPLEAARLANRALEGFSASSLQSKSAMCEILLARLHLESGRQKRARNMCHCALKRLDSMDVPSLQYQALLVLGLIEEAGGDWNAALKAYSASRREFERTGSRMQAEELKIVFVKDKLSLYENLFSLTVRRDMTVPAMREAFDYVERAKSRSLADLMAFRAHAVPPTISTRSDQAEQVRKLREELNWYYRQIDLQEMSADVRSRDEVEELRGIIRRQEENLLLTLRKLQKTDQEFSSLQESATVDLETIQSSIPEGTLLIEYYIARGIVYGCILGTERLEIVPVTVASRAKELHRLLQFQLSKFRFGDDYVNEFSDLIRDATRSVLSDLYAEVIAPIEGQVGEAAHLVVIPHSFLHYVPFHALFDGEQFMIDRFSISYAPSAYVYYLCCEKRVAAGKRSLVLGGVDSDEVRAVAEALAEAEVFMGREAGEFLSERRGESSHIIHIAARGFYRTDNPMFSAIEIGGSRVNLFDLFNLKLGAELLVLDGCGTGLQVGRDGDEVVGMTRGLLYAGARSVVVTLWGIGGDSNLLFLRSFFHHLLDSNRKAEALRKAILEVRRCYPDPFHWAPYLLVGEPFGR